MQWRLYDCFWQMRLPELSYLSEASIALTTYLHYQGNGAVIKVPASSAREKVRSKRTRSRRVNIKRTVRPEKGNAEEWKT